MLEVALNGQWDSSQWDHFHQCQGRYLRIPKSEHFLLIWAFHSNDEWCRLPLIACLAGMPLFPGPLGGSESGTKNELMPGHILDDF
jgi:hypothetical protein